MMWITRYWLSNSCTSLVLSSDEIQIRNLKKNPGKANKAVNDSLGRFLKNIDEAATSRADGSDYVTTENFSSKDGKIFFKSIYEILWMKKSL